MSERLKVARDLHDTVSQEIAALGYACDEAISLSAMGTSRDSLVAIRARLSLISLILRDELGLLRNQADALGSILTQFLAELSNVYPISIDSDLSLDPKLEIGAESQLDIYRALREIVINILVHSQARHLSVRGNQTSTELIITVMDDGITNLAFTETEAVQPGYHYGIAGLHERIAKIQGDISYQRLSEMNRYELRVPL